MSTTTSHLPSRPRGLHIALVVLGMIVGSPWPFGPLAVTAILYFTALRDAPAPFRRRVIWAGLAVSIVELVVVATLFMTGLAGHLMFSRSS